MHCSIRPHYLSLDFLFLEREKQQEREKREDRGGGGECLWTVSISIGKRSMREGAKKNGRAREGKGMDGARRRGAKQSLGARISSFFGILTPHKIIMPG